MAKGFILYKGKSNFDGKNIVVIATMRSKNIKTGNMIQTWILVDDMSPLDAVKNSCDASVCGDCKHRRNLGGACYVNIGQAPQNIYRAYQRGMYRPIKAQHLKLFKDRTIRLGAYGDPAMVPVEVWKPLLEVCSNHTGYTHLWQESFAQTYKGICMASVDNWSEMNTAVSQGWQTFRVKTADQSVRPDEITCPATVHDNITCETCKFCNGLYNKNVVIDVHGSTKKRFNGNN